MFLAGSEHLSKLGSRPYCILKKNSVNVWCDVLFVNSFVCKHLSNFKNKKNFHSGLSYKTRGPANYIVDLVKSNLMTQKKKQHN